MAKSNQNSGKARLHETVLNNELKRALDSILPADFKVKVESNRQIEGAMAERPDLVIRQPGGVPVVVETEYLPANSVEDDAKKRLGRKLISHAYPIEQSIAVRIKEKLAFVDGKQLEKEIESCEYEICLLKHLSGSFQNGDLEFERWPVDGWLCGSLGDLADIIELTGRSEKAELEAINSLEYAIIKSSKHLIEECEYTQNVIKKISNTLKQKYIKNEEEQQQPMRMAMSIVANAITFDMSLAGHRGIETLAEIWGPDCEPDKHSLLKHWKRITDINYLPIFDTAREILLPITDNVCRKLIEILHEASIELNKLGGASRHILCGRMLQRLIVDRKFLATYYTNPKSAALLAELVIGRISKDQLNKNELKKLRIADFACGTGTLLSSTLNTLHSKFRKIGKGDRKIQKFLIEDVVIGTDIMPAATHLTATMLASIYPGITFDHTSIYTLPYGKRSPRSKNSMVDLGSLDLLDDNHVFPSTKTGPTKIELKEKLMDQTFDIVIMNPPYTRPAKYAGKGAEVPIPSFAGLNNDKIAQQLMSKKLKKVRKPEMVGNGLAGLASSFIDVAHSKVKNPGGIVALVLPMTFLKGKSWEAARELFEEHYTDVVIMSIASAGKTNRAFSADTDMAEILIVATRQDKGISGVVRYINLKHSPNSMVEAVMIAREIMRTSQSSSKPSSIDLGDEEVATIFSGSFASSGFAGILHKSPALAGDSLTDSKIVLPRLSKPLTLPMVTISKLGKVGLLDREISSQQKRKDGTLPGPFEILLPTSQKPNYPILWSHNAMEEKRFIVKTDAEGRERENREEEAIGVWNTTKSRLHLNRDFRLNSQPLAACITENESIGGRAWPNYILKNDDWEIPMVLWLNTTIGLITFWWQGVRTHDGRATITNARLPELLVYDMRKLTKKQLKQAGEIFDSFKDKEFLPANEAWHDTSRQLLDQAVLGDLLGIPKTVIDDNYDTLRYQWCEEPSVHGGKPTAPQFVDRQK